VVAGRLRGDDVVYGSLQHRTGRFRRARGNPSAGRAGAHATSGRAGGVPFVTDGPYAETQEVLAGYWIVECDSFDRATEIAGRLAACPAPEQLVANAYADVRPIMESAAEMSY
jgi:hypothetical protein